MKKGWSFHQLVLEKLYAAAAAKSLQSCPTVCDPIDSSPPGSSVPGILQARTLEWVPFPSPMHESEKWKWSQSCPTLGDLMDCSLPGSSVHGIFQARVLEWVAIAFSEKLYILMQISPGDGNMSLNFCLLLCPCDFLNRIITHLGKKLVFHGWSVASMLPHSTTGHLLSP